jgi:hypothetical protein
MGDTHRTHRTSLLGRLLAFELVTESIEPFIGSVSISIINISADKIEGGDMGR